MKRSLKCIICRKEPRQGTSWCRICGEAYDRWNARSLGDVQSAYNWVARRAWRFAKACK